MRSKSSEKRGRQKVVRPPIYRIENEYNPEAMPQYFQISVNVLEGKKLALADRISANSYVVVILGKMKYRTRIRRNMDGPYYRESFVFELYTSILHLQQISLQFAIMEPRCCAPPRLIGEATVDLDAIWTQPHHQVFHKWAQLCLPGDPNTGPVGYLQVDVSIILKGDAHNIMPTQISGDKLEDNLLLPSGSEQQCANYLITIYGAFGLPTQSHGDKRLGKPPSTFVRVSFCGLVAKTTTQLRSVNPAYCAKISMVEMFPNMSQFIRLEVCSAEGCFNRVLACAQLKLGQISHDGENGFLPTFGPSLLHMYGTSFTGFHGLTEEDGPYHRGALLVALNTVVPMHDQPIRSVTSEPVVPIKLENIWILEQFCIFCPIFEVSLLDTRIAGKCCGVAITIAELSCGSEAENEFDDLINEVRAHKMHYTGSLEVFKNQQIYGYLDFSEAFPVLQLGTRLPDYRFRMYTNNMLHGIVTDLNSARTEVKRRLKNSDYFTADELMEELNKALDNASGNIIKFLDILQYSNPDTSGSEDNSMLRQYSTELDLKQLALQKEEIKKLHQQISCNFKSNRSLLSLTPSYAVEVGDNNTVTKKTIKSFLIATDNLVYNLNNLIHKAYIGWPDVIVWLLNGGSRVAYTKISAADLIHSVIPEQNGKDCGRIQSVYLKPLKCSKHVNTQATPCHCIVGKVELLLWMGLYRQRSAFESCLPSGYNLYVKNYGMRIKCNTMVVECYAFIYKAKLSSGRGGLDTLQTFVRINSMNSVQETKVIMCKTLSPVWNQVLKMKKVVSMTPERLAICPPVVLVEVNNTDLSGKTEIIGSVQVQPVVNDSRDYKPPPNLEWYYLYKGVECTGQLLMSVQLLDVQESVLKTTNYCSVEELQVPGSASISKEIHVPSDLQILPTNFLPVFTSFKVDIYLWGLRDLSGTKKPGVILDIEEISFKSELIVNKQSNCNFSDGRTSEIFEAPLNESYKPLLNIKLFDSSTFGRTLYLGTKTVKNTTKYIVNWRSKAERDASLRRVSIMSSDFVQVNQMLFIRKSSQLLKQGVIDHGSKDSMKNSPVRDGKFKKWQKLLCRGEPDEETYKLLPSMQAKEQIVARTSREEQRDWWLKYLRSQKDYDDEENISAAEKIIIYESELESQPEFSKFKDWCSSLKLYNGKKTGILEKDLQLYCGILKAGIAIYRWPPPTNIEAVTESGVNLNKGFFDDHPSNNPAIFLIRVYLIKGFNLKNKAYCGKSNPYVILNCGKNHFGDRYNNVANTFNPIFGRMYEFKCNLPEEYLLTVSLYNYEESQPDELIGTTSIDLENRIYSKHRARVGLPNEYSLTDKFKWRDSVKPSNILQELCSINHFPIPLFSSDSTSVMVNGIEYKDIDREKNISSSSERKENLCLSILRNWHTLPIYGYYLVPEHVETRTLYNPERPGNEHGKLHMWLEIFPLDTGAYIPPPIDIAPKKVEDFELRLTVYSVRNLNPLLQTDPSRVVSDFYVTASLGSSDEAQRTDVHYKTVGGESNFNWRMIFNFQYHPALRKIIRKEKGIFTEYNESISPILKVHLMDNGATCLDDNIGSLKLNLNAIPRGDKQIDECTLDTMKKSQKINLFSARSLRAWWPLSIIDVDSGKVFLVGKIDLEFALLKQEFATLMPVGVGREPPFALPRPLRPKSTIHRIYYKLKKNIYEIPSQSFWVLATYVFILLSIFLTLYYELPAKLASFLVRLLE